MITTERVPELGVFLNWGVRVLNDKLTKTRKHVNGVFFCIPWVCWLIALIALRTPVLLLVSVRLSQGSSGAWPPPKSDSLERKPPRRTKKKSVGDAEVELSTVDGF